MLTVETVSVDGCPLRTVPGFDALVDRLVGFLGSHLDFDVSALARFGGVAISRIQDDKKRNETRRKR